MAIISVRIDDATKTRLDDFCRGVGLDTSMVMKMFATKVAREQRIPFVVEGGEPATFPKPKQYYDNIYADRESMFRHSPYALEEKLVGAVTKGDGEAAMASLREITAQGEKAVLAKDSLRSAKNSMIGSIAFLSRAAIRGGVSANDAFALSDALTQRIEEMTARDAVLAFEENILMQFIALVRRRLEASYSAPIVKVMHYVENHLDAKVSLSDAASYAGVHPAYLSARFKREAGMPFTAYTAMRKIQESCYFVRHTGYPISQIALLYGFSGQSYYTAVFKRVTGVTPAEYRRRGLTE
ncbi:MAG: helix-turn-helix domain-containing protein [Clostridiales Family XIII bacterium]|jgi:addiction module RelB/DinJ family antitoxin|nr:helix-turn-helix domain-containing protein [Clostridiales Family XIII bacterium]